jgi:hypothetical protein
MDDTDTEAFFRQVTPEQFTCDTSYLTVPCDPGVTFGDCLHLHHAMVRFAFGSCDGQIHPVFALAVGPSLKYFKAEDFEPISSLVTRCAVFSRVHKARWLFMHQRVSVPTRNTSVDVVYWLAGRRTSRRVEYRQGYFEIDQQVLGARQDCGIEQQPDHLRKILEY